MPRLTSIPVVLLLAIISAARLSAYDFQHENWGIRATYPAEPNGDEFHSTSDRGPVVSERFFYENKTEAFLLLRMVHPVAFLTPKERETLYSQAKNEALHARPGDVTQEERFQLGPYVGRRFQIAFKKAGRVKEMRLILIGSSLFAISHERPAKEAISPAGAAFLSSIALQPGYEDVFVIEDRDRWRHLGLAPFDLRYDASRWYRDPEDKELGVFNLIHISKKAEVQFITEKVPMPGDDVEKTVLATAREGAESVVVKERATRLRNGLSFLVLRFEARVDGVTYVNRGRFYSGPEGAVQLRGWATQENFAEMDGDIGELLDGLGTTAKPK